MAFIVLSAEEEVSAKCVNIVYLNSGGGVGGDRDFGVGLLERVAIE